MKSLSCKQLGGPDAPMNCDFTAAGETAEDVKKAMFEHAGSVHKDVLAKMTPQDQANISAKMDQLIA